MARLIFLLTTASLLNLAAPADADDIGRLFFSPDERAMLEQWRQKGGGSGPEAATGAQIKLNGVVRRSSGKTTAWINQVPQQENEAPQGIAVLGSAAGPPGVPLRLPSGKKIEMKAGQIYDTASGKVHESYEGALPVPQAK